MLNGGEMRRYGEGKGGGGGSGIREDEMIRDAFDVMGRDKPRPPVERLSAKKAIRVHFSFYQDHISGIQRQLQLGVVVRRVAQGKIL